MDLKTFEFPNLNDTAAVRKATMELLNEAKERGFDGGYTEYNTLFSELFFNGGNFEFKKDVDEDFKAKAWPFCKGFMGSWDPKHEHKEAVCALLMSELLVAPIRRRK